MAPLQPQRPLNDIDLETIGDSGTHRYSGYFSEEFQFEWRDHQRVVNVETMRRTDGTVKQFLTAIKTPILATEYDVIPSGDSPQEQEHAAFIKENLFNMRRTWKEFMREAVTSFDFGHSVFELIYAKKKGKIYLADLEPRIQSSILNWQLDDGRRGIVQILATDEEPTSKPLRAQIPMNKLLVFTNDKEGDDLTGQSDLRPCYKHFKIKDTLYRISAISCERYGVGIPVVTLPDGATDQDKTDAENMGSNIRSNEKGYIVKPSKDWVVEILTPSGNPQQGQIDSLIQHHDRMILMAGLMGFLNLGSDSTGSFALSKDQSSFFLKHCEDRLQYMVEQIEKQVIQRLIIINFGVQEKYPKLTFTPLGDIDFAEYSNVLKTLKDSGFVDKVRVKDMQFVRKTFKMPILTDDEMFDLEQKELEDQLAAISTSDTGLPPDANAPDNMPIPAADDEADLPEEIDDSTDAEAEAIPNA